MENIEKEHEHNGNLIDYKSLYKLYVDEMKPMHEISDELNVSVGSVYNYIRRYGINSRPAHMGFKGKTHTASAREKMSLANRGKKVSLETRHKMSESSVKGGIGHKKKRPDGYIKIYFPDHPRSNADGYIMEHILVMESLIGRHLKENECVHHINFKKDDNRKENLKLMTKSEHMSFHAKYRREKLKNAQ